MRISLLLILAASPVALAEQCDCQKIIGQCSGAIDFVKGYGSKPSYGAEIVVHSSEKICSKVEYYVDGTPYQTVLVNKSQEPESLFGTSPITQKSVTYRSCQVCARVDTNKGAADGRDRSQISGVNDFEGTWTGSGRNSLGFSQTYTVKITSIGANRYQIDQVQKAFMSTTNSSGTGSSSGKTLPYQIHDGAVDCTMTLKSSNTASRVCNGYGTSNEAALTKQ
ncbi:hypothetical protein [Pseudomonas sp.]|uniref:hypothetical protein n=1 Tax=Pseudomonas sp. TaxID=306 RepID=UPI001B2F8118|nr:hypothetical protein [Pseudomonas sp.]MBO9552188.1 hypothetical protein [Pseudomonas sp.]